MEYSLTESTLCHARMLPVQLKFFRGLCWDRFWGPKMCPKRAGALLGHIVGPDPRGMDPKIGQKISPGRILIKPEALLPNIE